MLDPGQPKGSQNALRHGIYSSEIVLLGEREEDFIALLNEFQSELNPGTALEEEAVLDLARLHWLKRRAIKAAKRQFRHQEPGQNLPENRIQVVRSISDVERVLGRLLKAVHKLQTTISVTSGVSEDIESCTRDCGHAINDVADYKIHFRDVINALTFRNEQSMDYTYEPADLERLVKVEALIDTRIEKILARIARIKEFGRLYGHKEVASD